MPLGKTLWGRIKWEFGRCVYTVPYTKSISNKDLLYSTGKSTQYSVMAYRGRSLKKNECVCVYN